MKLLILGDCHLRFRNPENRTDNFHETQYAKMKEALKIGKSEGCACALQPGDLWDSPNPARFVMARYIALFHEVGMKFFTVIGQHDMTMRNFDQVDRTATYLLRAARVLTIVGLDCEPLMPGKDADGPIWLHGLSYEQDYEPNPIDGCLNILLAHVSVGDRKLFPDHELTAPKAFARKHPGMELIVVGDYHYTFVEEVGSQLVINAGCLVRKSIDEHDLAHQPSVFVYDTESGEYEQHYLKTAKPWEEVFVIPAKDSNKNDRIAEILELLREDRKLAVSFSDNLQTYYKKVKVRKRVQAIIAKAMDVVDMPLEERRDS